MQPSGGLQQLAHLAARLAPLNSGTSSLTVRRQLPVPAGREVENHRKQPPQPACPGHIRIMIRFVQLLAPQKRFCLRAI